MDMWNAPMVKSRQPLTYRLMESWAWEAQDDMETSDREVLQRVETLCYDPHHRHTRSGVRSAMRAASQLPGRGPIDVDVAPIPTH